MDFAYQFYAEPGSMPGRTAWLEMNSLQGVVSSTSIDCGVEASYESRLAELHQRLSHAQRRRGVSLWTLVGCTVILVFSFISGGRFRLSTIAAIPAAGITFSLREYLKNQSASKDIALRCGFYERGLERLRRNWKALERTGEEFARPGHLYQFDLQILGERSLFSLLCTTRTQAGDARLAEYLLDPVDLDEVRARQAAVRELREIVDFRERIALLGKYSFQGCDPDKFREWMNMPLLQAPAAVPVYLLTSTFVMLVLAVASLVQVLSWTHALPVLIPLVIAQAVVSAPLWRGVRLRLRILRSITAECSVLREGLQLLESQIFVSPKLRDLVDRSKKSNASFQVRRLEQLFGWIAQREKELFFLPSLLTATGTQLVLAVERWRAKYQEQLDEWIDIWAEFDALNAIACYAWEHPGQIFPEFVDEETTLRARDLGHPLLPPDCVRNDVVLDESQRFWILSGSNMAGKSTLLRAVGMNAVLAYAGASICASEAQLSNFAVCASISLSDSLLDGKSKFLAETERLSLVLRKTHADRPALFLIDEILSGTNSRDRRLASESIVRALIAGGAVGILSTHDLALTAIADEPGLNGSNCCMESSDLDQPLNFDYRIKPGITRRSSAMAIIRLLGIGANSQ
jgi:hypothetical protein